MPQNNWSMKFLYPPILLNRPNPLSVGLALCWQSSLLVLSGYLLILPFALVGGLNLASTTLAYFSDVFPALSPVTDVLLSHWLFYSYFHYIVAPLTGVALQGSTLTVFTLLTLSPLVIVFGSAAAGGMFDLTIEHPFPEYLHKTEPHIRLMPSVQTTQLSFGWTHGHHPPTLYE